jgi:carbonic anhydrase
MTDQETAHEIWDELSNSFNVMMGAAEGKLATPIAIETSTSGEDEAECLGSIRHIAEYIEDNGYEVSVEKVEEAEPLPSSEMRIVYELTITSGEN